MSQIKNIASVLFEDLKTVGASFKSPDGGIQSTSYTFKCRLDVEIGDPVIVDTIRGLKVATITEIHNVPMLEDNIEYRWVVQKIDLEHHNSNLTFEENAAANIQALKRKKMLDAVREQLAEQLNVSTEELTNHLLGKGE